MNLTEQIKDTIELLKGTGINGCITGSSMLDADFDMWESHPDVDVFVFAEPQLLDSVNLLMYKHGFEPATKGEAWKIDRIRNRGMKKNASLQTVKLKHGDVVVNITWKYGKTTMASVLASFDMSIIMIGWDIRHGFGMDLRTRTDSIMDPDGKWSDDPRVAVPNPLRDQDVDMYGTEMWVRQFDRVIKYWNRGYDTRKMARFYIELIERVISNGQLFASESATNAFQEFVDVYEPLRDKMVEWLKDKEDC